jgi:hypothetical protein
MPVMPFNTLAMMMAGSENDRRYSGLQESLQSEMDAEAKAEKKRKKKNKGKQPKAASNEGLERQLAKEFPQGEEQPSDGGGGGAGVGVAPMAFGSTLDPFAVTPSRHAFYATPQNDMMRYVMELQAMANRREEQLRLYQDALARSMLGFRGEGMR